MRVHGKAEGEAIAATPSPALAPLEPDPIDAQDLEALDGLLGLADVVRRHYGRPLHILLVIDDDAAAEAFDIAAEESVLDVGIDVVADSDAALAYIDGALTQRRGAPMPDVVVCALVVEESHDLLEALRPLTEANALPVIVLSDETGPALERRSFLLGAAGHLRAPTRQYERVALIHTLPDFLPQGPAAG